MHQTRNVIPGLRKVDWGDEARQNEFLNCVISAMGHLGKNFSYDDLACISGCAFRACSPNQEITPGAYHVSNDIAIIGHTFRMLGYNATLHYRSNYDIDRQLIIDSIDRGVPALTFDGVMKYSDCCIISGYDDDGAVLLGWNPFMYGAGYAHDEPHDSTGYFRKSDWHDGFFKENNGKILIIGEPVESLGKEEITRKSLRMAAKLIRGTASKSADYVTGYAGATHYAELICQDTDDWFLLEEMMVCLGCNLYQDKLYVAPFLREAKTVLNDNASVIEECAKIYDQISDLRREMARYLPEDQNITGERILDKEFRKQYAQRVCSIRDLEKIAAELFEKI